MTASPSPRPRGARVAERYAVERKLGSGALGSVYLAHDLVEDRRVALKLLRRDLLDPAAIARLQEEFRALASLRHPQIAAAYDFGYTGEGIPFFTREYIEGTPLAPGPPPSGSTPRDYLQPILDVLEALEHLHRRGILHLDVHAGNCIESHDPKRGTVLIDFGLAGAIDAPERARDFGPAVPPEVLQSAHPTHLADVYLAGKLLHFRLVGELEEIPRLPREIPGWGVRRTLDLERIVAKAARTAPAERFQSVSELRAAVVAVLGKTRGAAGRRAPELHDELIGRDKELLAIEKVLDRAASGARGCICISGRPGAGKSRLLREARISAQIRGLETLSVSLLPGTSAEPSLVRSLRRAPFSRQPVPRWLDALDPSHGGSPEERAARAAEVFLSEEGAATAILLDDFDRGGEESRLLVRALWRESQRLERDGAGGRGLALVVASRTPPHFPGDRGRVVSLAPLGPRDARQLLQRFLLPLDAPRALLRDALAKGGGLPLRLRQIALAIRDAWESEAGIPEGAALPAALWRVGPPKAGARAAEGPERKILEALAVLECPLTAAEIASIAGEAPKEVRRALHRLLRSELVVATGTPRRYELALAEDASSLLERVPRPARRGLHARRARALEASGSRSPLEEEQLARHILGCGRTRDGGRIARRAARRLREAGSFHRAIVLLEDFARVERDTSRRLELIEAISDIAMETGDHERGIAALEPLYRVGVGEITPKQRVELGRRLGIHFHRGGHASRALEVFEETRARADPARDVVDLILVDSELAEIHLFRDSMDAAEAACRRGLSMLEASSLSGEAGGRLEVVLRASLGHIHLRRMRPEDARRELERSLELSRKYGTLAERAAILHNLAATANALNDLRAGRHHFLEAERLLVRAGDRRNLVKISTNLAVLAAKLAEPDESRAHLARSAALVRLYPGDQLEFFALYSKGITSLILGDAAEAAGALEKALPLGRRAGDQYLVRFGEVYLAEAYLACGRYGDALHRLDAAVRSPDPPPPVLGRMAASRRYLVEALLGRERAASRALRAFESLPRSDVPVLEAWNDIFCGLGKVVSGELPETLESAAAVFDGIGMPYAVRAARVARLAGSIAGGKTRGIIRELQDPGAPDRPPHPFLDVAESLARAEASLDIGHDEAAEAWLDRAAGDLVGLPFLELDWRLELLRARLAWRRGDRHEARRHLHRSRHARDHMVELVPRGARKSFLAHPRFRLLGELAGRLERSPRVLASTERLWQGGSYEGLIGRSDPMVRVFETIERLRDQDVPVLILGETGTGKELVARAIYRTSRRGRSPFHVLHCASLPEELFASELFGHEAGAFTGAEEERAGILDELRGGTLLFDEVAELARGAQGQLLQVLDSGRIRRLGSSEMREVDVRFLFTATSDLATAVEEGRLRGDLLYRIRGIEIRVPPLRERRSDIALLARHLAERHAARLERPPPALDPEALRLLEEASWPGNVRELESLLLRVLLELPDPRRVRAADIERQLEGGSEPAGEPFSAGTLLERPLEDWKVDLERRYLTELFAAAGGRADRMLERLGIRRTTLYAWFRRLGIDPQALRRKLREERRRKQPRGEGRQA